ncbi:MAG TPA: metallophosphoesterase family protein [Gemmatimonadaceae bacterium]|nr:metallophosphoesterase family protein [Gemmatimonadaceae bacterium]
MATEHLIGLISDTHGLLRPDVHDALTGVDLILHAGDVGGEEILQELQTIAPTFAVHGNTDAPAPYLEAEIIREIGGLSIHVSHGHEVGRPTPERLLARYSQDIVVYGHTHKQLLLEWEGRIVVNPGAAGQRRFDLPPSVARLRIAAGAAGVSFVELDYSD